MVKCPMCGSEITSMKFFNVSLTTNCPQCVNKLIFTPKMIPMIFSLIFSYAVSQKLPSLNNDIFDFIVGFIVIFILVMICLYLLIRFKQGTIQEFSTKYRRLDK